MKILIAIPCMDMIDTPFAASLCGLRRVGDCQFTFVTGSLVYDSRNKIAAKAIELGSEYVMWFDSDMTFQPDTLERLMAHMEDKDIVSGLYFRRAGTYNPVLFSGLHEKENGTIVADHLIDYPKDEVFEVAGIGFGCVLMKTSVLFDMAAALHDWFTPNGRVGEDLSFCLRASKLGYKIWVDPTIKCGHVGSIIVTDEFFNAYKTAEGSRNESKS